MVNIYTDAMFMIHAKPSRVFSFLVTLFYMVFSYEFYKCRCHLAAIDYTKHMDRPVAYDKVRNRSVSNH